MLQKWSRDNVPWYRQLIAELDRLLRATCHVTGRGVLPVQCSADVRRYMQVLRSVSVRSGRSPSFGDCADRIRIGNALIEEARRTGQPSTTSISLLGKAASSSQSSSSSST
jgi:hypothetical protein